MHDYPRIDTSHAHTYVGTLRSRANLSKDQTAGGNVLSHPNRSVKPLRSSLRLRLDNLPAST